MRRVPINTELLFKWIYNFFIICHHRHSQHICKKIFILSIHIEMVHLIRTDHLHQLIIHTYNEHINDIKRVINESFNISICAYH